MDEQRYGQQRQQPRRGNGSNDIARALLPKRIHLLTGETDQQTVLLLVLRNVFNDIGRGLCDGHPLDGRLATQLFDHAALLLQIVGDQVHDGSLGKAYGERCL